MVPLNGCGGLPYPVELPETGSHVIVAVPVPVEMVFGVLEQPESVTGTITSARTNHLRMHHYACSFRRQVEKSPRLMLGCRPTSRLIPHAHLCRSVTPTGVSGHLAYSGRSLLL